MEQVDPQALGRLDAIWLKRAHRGPMDVVERATAVPGRGFAEGVAHGSTRQITLIDRETWDMLMRETGGRADPSARRANLMVSGIPLANSRGRVLRIGSVRLRIGGETRPCERMDDAQAGLRAAMHAPWRGGAYAQVIEGGVVAVGDPVDWEPAKPNAS
jgi:MOSC domain-containing protein YiiM